MAVDLTALEAFHGGHHWPEIVYRAQRPGRTARAERGDLVRLGDRGDPPAGPSPA